MSALLPWLLLAALLVHFGAHVTIVVSLALRARTEGARAIVRAALAFVVSPLAPLWAWRLGMKRAAIAWCVGVTLYAIGVAAS